MNLGVTMVFYLLVGAGVTVAVFLSDAGRSASDRLLRLATAALFWPLYVPILLARRDQDETPIVVAEPPVDELALAIAQANAELDAAMESLDGLAEETLARETVRIGELKSAWSHQAQRIREMDRLLSQLRHGRYKSASDANGADGMVGGAERSEKSDRARAANIERLGLVRNQAYEDLTGTIAWVRELVTMIHLAKFTGAPASRAEELVARIAAAVHGLSEVTQWEDRAAKSTELHV